MVLRHTVFPMECCGNVCANHLTRMTGVGMSESIYETLGQIVRGVNENAAQTPAGVLMGRNLGGTTNTFDNAFFRDFANGYADAQAQGKSTEYFLNGGTGLAPVDQSGVDAQGRQVEVLKGDVFSNGVRVGNLYDSYGTEQADQLLTKFWVSGEDQRHGVTFADVAPRLQTEMEKRSSRESFDSSVQGVKDEWDSKFDIVSPLSGAAGGAVVGAGIGSFFTPVGTVIGGILGAAAGGLGGWLNRDETEDIAARAEVQARMLADEGHDVASAAQRLGQWSAVAARAMAPASNLVHGGFDAAVGTTGDDVSSFYATDATGDQLRPGWLTAVDVGAGLIDAAGLFGGSLKAGATALSQSGKILETVGAASAGTGARLFQAQMGGQIISKAGVLAGTGGETFDDRRGDFDSIFRDDDGSLNLLSAAAGMADIGIDVVQLGLGSAMAGVAGRAGVSTGSRNWDRFLGFVGEDGQRVLGGRKFTITGDVALGTDVAVGRVGRLPSIQIVAPSEFMVFSMGRAGALVQKARNGGGTLTADDLYQATKRIVESESKLRVALVNGFGEGAEEAVQAVLEPVSHEDRPTFEDVALSYAYGATMGAGMSLGARFNLPTAEDRRVARAETLYQMRNGGNAMPNDFWSKMTPQEQSDWLVLEDSAESLLTGLSKEFATAEVRQMVTSQPELAAVVAAFQEVEDQEKQTLNSAAEGRYQMAQAHYGEIDDYMVQGSISTLVGMYELKIKALAEVLQPSQIARLQPGQDVRLQQTLDATRAIQAQLREFRTAFYLDGLGRRGAAEVVELANAWLQLNYKVVPDPQTEAKFANALQTIVDRVKRVAHSKTRTKDPKEIARIQALENGLRLLANEMATWSNGFKRPTSVADAPYAKAVTLLLGRDPQNSKGSTQLLLPQVSLRDSARRADNYLRVTHGPLQPISGDFDGDMLNLLTRIVLDDTEYMSKRIATDLYTSWSGLKKPGDQEGGPKSPVNLMVRDFEPEMLAELRSAFGGTNKAFESNAKFFWNSVEAELKQLLPFATKPINELYRQLRYAVGETNAEAFVTFRNTLATEYANGLQQRSLQLGEPVLLRVNSLLQRHLLKFQQGMGISNIAERKALEPNSPLPVVLTDKGHERWFTQAATMVQKMFLNIFGSDMFRKHQKLHYTDFNSTQLGTEAEQRSTTGQMVQLYETVSSQHTTSAIERLNARDELTANVVGHLVRMVSGEAGKLPSGGRAALAVLANLRVPDVVLERYEGAKPHYKMTENVVSLTQFLLKMESYKLEQRDRQILDAKPELRSRYLNVRTLSHGQAFVEVFGAFTLNSLMPESDSWVLGGNLTVSEFVADYRNQDNQHRQDQARLIRQHASYKRYKDPQQHIYPILPEAVMSGKPEVTAYQAVVDAMLEDANTTISWDANAPVQPGSPVLGKVLGSIGRSSAKASQSFQRTIADLQQLMQSPEVSRDTADPAAWEKLINSDPGLASKVWAIFTSLDKRGAWQLKGEHAYRPNWVYQMFGMEPRKAEMEFFRRTLLASYNATRRFDADGVPQQRREEDFKNRWHRLLWQLEEEYKRNPLSMARDRFLEQLLTAEDPDAFQSWVNNEIRGNEAPFTIWNSDIAELDPAATKGGLSVVLEGATQRQAIADLEAYVGLFRQNLVAASAAEARDTAIHEELKAALRAKLDPAHTGTVLFRELEKRLETAARMTTAFGPQARSRLLTMNMLMLANATDKGKTAQGFRAMGEYLSQLVGLQFGTPEQTLTSSLTAFDLDSARANPSFLMQDDLEFLDDQGRKVHSEVPSAEQFVELWETPANRPLLMAMVSPMVFEHVGDDRVGARFVNDLSLGALLDKDFSNSLLFSNARHDKALYIGFLESLMDSRQATAYVSEVMYSQATSRKSMLFEYDEANSLADEALSSVVDALRIAGRLYRAKAVHRRDRQGRIKMDAAGNPEVIPAIDAFAESVKDRLRKTRGAALDLDDLSKKIMHEVQESHRLAITRLELDGTLSAADAQAQLELLDSMLETDFMQKAVRKYGSPVAEKSATAKVKQRAEDTQTRLVEFVHEHPDLMSMHQHVTGIAAILKNVQEVETSPGSWVWEAPDVQAQIAAMKLTDKQWQEVAGSVLSYLITRETTTPLTANGLARIQPRTKTELDLRLFDPNFEFLVDDLFSSESPLAKGAAELINRLEPSAKNLDDAKDLEDQLFRTILKPERLGTWTPETATGIQQGIDRLLAGAEKGVSRAGSGPAFTRTTGVAYQRTLIRPPKSMVSTAKVTLGALRSRMVDAPIEITHPNGITEKAELRMLTGRFAEEITYNDPVQGPISLTSDVATDPRVALLGVDVNGVAADPSLGAISVPRVALAAEAALQAAKIVDPYNTKLSDNLVIEVQIYHPRMQPDQEAFANNAYFEGLAMEQGDAFLSSEAAWWFAPGGIDQRNEQAALKSVKKHTDPLAKPETINSSTKQLTELDWRVDFLGMLIEKARTIMSRQLGDGTYLSEAFYNAVLLNLKRRHLVRWIEPDGTVVVKSAEEVIAMQARASESRLKGGTPAASDVIPANADLYMLSERAQRTMLSERGGQGELRVPSPARSTDPLSIPRWPGHVTQQHLEMLPGLTEVTETGTEFADRSLFESSAINLGQLFRLSRWAGLTETTRNKFTQFNVIAAQLASDIGMDRTQLPEQSIFSKSETAAAQLAQSSLVSAESLSMGRGALGFSHPSQGDQLLQLLDARNLDRAKKAAERGTNGVWRIYHHTVQTVGQMEAFGNLVGLKSLDKSGPRYSWVSPTDTIVINLDSFKPFDPDQQEIELAKVLLTLLDIGAQVTLADPKGEFAGLSWFGAQFLTEHNMERVPGMKSVFQRVPMEQDSLSTQARFDKLLETRLLETYDYELGLATNWGFLQENSAIALNPHNRLRAAWASDPVRTEELPGFKRPTPAQMEEVRRLVGLATPELEQLSYDTYHKNDTTTPRKIDNTLIKELGRVQDFEDSGMPAAGAQFGTGSVIPRVRVLVDGTTQIYLHRHGHVAPSPEQLNEMLSKGRFAISSTKVDEDHSTHTGTVTEFTPEAPYGFRVYLRAGLQTLGAKLIDEYGVKFTMIPMPVDREIEIDDFGARPFQFISGLPDHLSKEGALVTSIYQAIPVLGIDFTPDIARHMFSLDATTPPTEAQLADVVPALKAFQREARKLPHLDIVEIEMMQRLENLPRSLYDKIFPTGSKLLPNLNSQSVEARITRAMLTYLLQDGAEVEHVLLSGGMNSQRSLERGHYSREMPRLFTDVFDRTSLTDPLRLHILGKLNAQLSRTLSQNGSLVTGAQFRPDMVLEVVAGGTKPERLEAYLTASRYFADTANPTFQSMAQKRRTSNPASDQRHEIAALTHRAEVLTSKGLQRMEHDINRDGMQDLADPSGLTSMLSNIDTSLVMRPRVSSTQAERWYAHRVRNSMFKNRQPLTMDAKGGWAAEDITAYNSRRSSLVAKYGLPSGMDEIVDYWIRQRTGSPHDQEPEDAGGNPGRVSPDHAMQELANIDDAMSRGLLPTYAILPKHSQMPILHSQDLRMLYRASQVNGKFILHAGPNDDTVVTAWDDWVSVALGIGGEAGEAIDLMFLPAIDGFLHTYHQLGVKYSDLPMSVNAFRTERLLDPATSQLVREAYDPEYQQELYSVSPHVRESLREDNILVARASLEDMFKGTTVGLAKDDADVETTSAARSERKRLFARRKREAGDIRSDQKTTKNLLEHGRKFTDAGSTTNRVLRSLYLQRVSLAMLNPMLYLGAPIEATQQSLMEASTNLVSGSGLAVTNKEITPEIRAEYKKLIQTFGSRKEFKAMIGNEFRMQSVLYDAGPVERFWDKVARVAGTWQDPYWGMRSDIVAKQYLEAAYKYIQSEHGSTNLTASMLAHKLEVNERFLIESHWQAHKAAVAKLLEIRNVRPTVASIAMRGIVEPLSQNPRLVPQVLGVLGLKMPYAFLGYNINKAIQLSGLQGVEAWLELMLHGRKNPIFGRLQAAIGGYEYDSEATIDMSDAIESLDITDAFIKSGLTHSSLFAFGMMAGGLGLSGEDEEDRRRRRAARYQGMPTLYDPMDIANDFRNADAIYLDWLPEPIAGWFRVTDESAAGGARSMAELNWIMKAVFNPIIGMERFFSSGNPMEVVWAYKDLFTSLPLVNTMLWDDANRVYAEMVESASAYSTDTGRPQDQPESFNALLRGFMRYEQMFLESSFINQIYAAIDKYDRDPYAVVARENGEIVRDKLDRPERTDVLQQYKDEETGELGTAYQRADWQESALKGFTENRATLALLMNLFTPGERGYDRFSMAPKMRTIAKEELSLEDARVIYGDLVESIISAQDLTQYAGSALQDSDPAFAATLEESKAVAWGLWKGTVSLDSPALQGFYMTTETRKQVKAELIARLTADYMAAGLTEYKATQFAWDAWKGSSTNPNAVPLNDIVMSDAISYKQSDRYLQLNTLYVQGPDGYPWATGIARNSIFNLLGMAPLQRFNAGEVGLESDQILNAIDPVRGINTGMRSLEKWDPSSASDYEDNAKGYSTDSDGSSGRSSNWVDYGSSRGSGYSSRGYTSYGRSSGSSGGSFTKMSPPDNQQVPYANTIDNLNTSNSLIRRASIRRERIDSQKGRLKPWQ